VDASTEFSWDGVPGDVDYFLSVTATDYLLEVYTEDTSFSLSMIDGASFSGARSIPGGFGRADHAFLPAQLPTYWITVDGIDSRAWSPEALVGTRVMTRCELARRKMERSP
jgi:hypothetical protein